MNQQSDSDSPDAAEQPAAYRVLARKYRPQRLEELIGQDAMVRTLANAFATGRIAQAYMLTGVRGVGKTTTARLIARALNYTGADGPTVEMPEFGEHCQAILESRHVDVIEMDAASKTGVGDVREIIESVKYRPISARYKVYIIDEVHMLSKAAFNALLKTLEEPPEHVKFVFATTEIRKVPVTVLSRCQRFDLRRLDIDELSAHFARIAVAEDVKADADAVALIARAAEGSVRDGLSLLDQAIAFGDKQVRTDDVIAMLGLADQAQMFDLLEQVMKGDTPAALGQMEKQYEGGADPYAVISDLAKLVHWITKLKIVPEGSERSGRTETELVRGREFADSLSVAQLTRAWQMLLKGLDELAMSAQPQMTAEMIVIRLAHAADMPTPADLVARLRNAPEGTRAATPSASSAPPASAQPVAPPGPPPHSEVPEAGDQPTAALATAHDYEPAPPANPSQPPRLQSFADIVAFTGERRDIKLKSQLERLVRPVSVTHGKVEIALEPDAPQGLPGELSRKLEAWTGTRWVVLVSSEDGEKPIAQARDEQRASLFDEARRNPSVQAVLETFPGAEIVNVTPPDLPDMPDGGEFNEDT